MAFSLAPIFAAVIFFGLHYANYMLSKYVAQGILVPILSKQSTSDNFITSLNGRLYKLGVTYKVRFPDNKNGSSSQASHIPYISTKDKWSPSKGHIPIVRFINNLLFNSTVSLSLQIVWLFLFDIAGVFDSPVKTFDTNITLMLLTITLSYLVPAWVIQCVIYQKINKSHNNKKVYNLKRLAIAFCTIEAIWILVLKAFSSILLKSGLQLSKMSMFQVALYRISIFGVVCMAILNGTGCISSVFSFIAFAKSKVSKGDVVSLAKSLKLVDSLIISRKQRFSMAENNYNDESLLDNELSVLEGNRDDLIRRLALASENCLRKEGERNMGQKFGDLFELGLVAYCAYRVINNFLFQIPVIVLAKVGILNKKASEQDPISATLAQIAVKYLNTGYSLEQLAVLIDIGFAVCLFICSFRSVELTLSNIGKALQFKIGFEDGTPMNTYSSQFSYVFSLVVAEVTGIYVLSTILLLDNGSLQSQPKDESLNSEYIDAHSINVLYSSWFGLSAVCSLIGLYTLQKFQNFSGNDFDDDEFDEEKLVEGIRTI